MKKIAMLLLLIAIISADQLKVPSAYSTIQAAIDYAVSGDTILVSAGTYKENLNYNGKNLVIAGENMTTTIIDGNQSGSVVSFISGEDSTAILKNFTITNSGGFNEGDYGGGVYVNASMATLDSLLITDNDGSGASYQGGAGGVAVIRSGKVYISNSTIRNTLSGYDAGALFANKDGDIVATNCLIADNKTPAVLMGTFLVGSGGNDVTLNNCTIVNNLGPAILGAMKSWGTLIATNSIIYNNINQEGKNQSENCSDYSDGDCENSQKISYSLIQGGYSGAGNIDKDPEFCDTLSYRYYDTSPAVGAGENGSNIGAGIGCGLPSPFKWVSSASDTINISQSNLADTYTLQWDPSFPAVEGTSINYLVYAKIGQYPAEEIFDTTATDIFIPYQEIAEGAFEGLPGNRATVHFSVWAHDGTDSVQVGGEDRVLYVNRYEYLSIEGDGVPNEFALHENYPNPFNPTTQIRFDLPEMGNVTLAIYNMLGQKVKTFNMQSAQAGYHALTWNATNDLGAPVSGGVYLYQLQTDGFVNTKKMILLK